MPDSFDLFNGQFLFSTDPAAIPPAWNHYEQAGWVIATHPDLPVTSLVLPDRTRLGWLIGYAITDTSFCPEEIIVRSGHARDEDALEATLATLGGRFVAVLLTATHQRCYLDACGSMSAVYSTRVPLVASTPSLIDTAQHPWDADLIRDMRMPMSGLWYPFGLTARQHVARIIPNHYLNLATMQPVRWWPPASMQYGHGSVDQALATITTTVRHALTTVAATHPLYLTLTAGRDSRMVLACARDVCDRTIFFTFTLGRDTADAHIARSIARRFQLSHMQLRKIYADPVALELWQTKTGRAVAGEIWKIHVTMRDLDPARVLMTGMAGEVGRGYYWNPADTADTPLTPADLVARCHLPWHPRFAAPAQAWLNSVPTSNTFFLLDLLYVEQRLGCWGGPQIYGGDQRNITMIQLLPLAHRAIFEAMFALPVDYRRDQRLAADICRTLWPELATLPYNQFSGFWRYPRQVARYGLTTARSLAQRIKYR
jgi:hypothetical protein